MLGHVYMQLKKEKNMIECKQVRRYIDLRKK